jgi:hypothetical protein
MTVASYHQIFPFPLILSPFLTIPLSSCFRFSAPLIIMPLLVFGQLKVFVQRHNLQSGPVPKFPRYNLNPFFVRETLCSCFCGNIFTVRSPLRQSLQPHRFVLRLDCADSELPLERVDRFKKCTLILDYIFLKCIIL